MVSRSRAVNAIEAGLPLNTSAVTDGVPVPVFTRQELAVPVGFRSISSGALFPAGGAPVVALPEADHGPSPWAFPARTCTR